MDLGLPGIYAHTLRGIRNNLLVYLLLLLWGLAQGIILAALVTLGALIWLGSVATLKPGPNMPSSALYITATLLGILLLVLGLLSATTRAGILSFGSKIRKGEKAGAGDFFRGIIRFTLPLFIGGIIVGMLSSIPALVFLVFARWSVTGIASEVLTTGWNFARALELLRYLWNLMLVAGAAQIVIFFWMAPWDEMVVLYELPYPEALARSFSFVFSRRHFIRVIGLTIANALIAQIVLLLTNMGVFLEGLETGAGFGYLRVLINASSSSITSFAQFALLPFFAFSQLYLLPWPKKAPQVIEINRVAEGTAELRRV